MDDSLSFEDYQRLAARTAVYPDRESDDIAPYPALGLAGESGEVAEQIKKAIRDDGGAITDERRAALRKELGDVLWYLSALCDELGLELADVAGENIDKLRDRQQRGVISGDGDER